MTKRWSTSHSVHWHLPDGKSTMPLPDVSSALKSFQQALIENAIQVQRGDLDRKMLVYMDQPNGETRLTYARVSGRTVVALIQFVSCDPYEGEPCFNVGWAVAEDFQGQGKAHEAVVAALKEMRNGFTRAGMKAFWVEAIVGEDNVASQRLAEKVLSSPIKRGADSFSGDLIVQYLRRVDAQMEL